MSDSSVKGTNRTNDEAFANEMDCDLYRLLLRAERQSKQDKHWCKVVRALRDARPHIRVRMHAKDRADTV